MTSKPCVKMQTSSEWVVIILTMIIAMGITATTTMCHLTKAIITTMIMTTIMMITMATGMTTRGEVIAINSHFQVFSVTMVAGSASAAGSRPASVIFPG